MRIDRLNLIAFGPFTDAALDLSQGSQGLHVVFGPNESGKSSSLRALRQLLYGIPVHSSDNFVHSYKQMRIGGVLKHSDGTVLSLVRRKGAKNTLRDESDKEPIDESLLSGFLDGLEQSFFESMFGIDHPTLIAGGQELCSGKGELGQILFSAGTGVVDIQGLAQGLSDEAGELFLPTGTKPRINTALARLKEAQRELKELEVPSSEWERHDEALKEAGKEKAALEKSMAEAEKTAARLERIKEALPLVAKHKEVMKTLAALADTIMLPEDFGERARQLKLDLKRTETEIRSTADEITRLAGELDKI